MPLFPGGETEMFRFLMKNTLYPQDDKLVGNQGTVFVYFVIDKNGFPTNIKIMNPKRGKENLEKEAMRVIGKMPQWIPGKQNGKPALVSFTLPIRFFSNYFVCNKILIKPFAVSPSVLGLSWLPFT